MTLITVSYAWHSLAKKATWVRTRTNIDLLSFNVAMFLTVGLEKTEKKWVMDDTWISISTKIEFFRWIRASFLPWCWSKNSNTEEDPVRRHLDCRCGVTWYCVPLTIFAIVGHVIDNRQTTGGGTPIWKGRGCSSSRLGVFRAKHH